MRLHQGRHQRGGSLTIHIDGSRATLPVSAGNTAWTSTPSAMLVAGPAKWTRDSTESTRLGGRSILQDGCDQTMSSISQSTVLTGICALTGLPATPATTPGCFDVDEVRRWTALTDHSSCHDYRRDLWPQRMGANTPTDSSRTRCFEHWCISTGTSNFKAYTHACVYRRRSKSSDYSLDYDHRFSGHRLSHDECWPEKIDPTGIRHAGRRGSAHHHQPMPLRFGQVPNRRPSCTEPHFNLASRRTCQVDLDSDDRQIRILIWRSLGIAMDNGVGASRQEVFLEAKHTWRSLL